jgi:hypothetical protein
MVSTISSILGPVHKEFFRPAIFEPLDWAISFVFEKKSVGNSW